MLNTTWKKLCSAKPKPYIPAKQFFKKSQKKTPFFEHK
jgi:hypothetical protein